jgi:hypothetical protein
MTEQQVAADVQAGRLVHLLPGWQVPLGALCLYSIRGSPCNR